MFINTYQLHKADYVLDEVSAINMLIYWRLYILNVDFCQIFRQALQKYILSFTEINNHQSRTNIYVNRGWSLCSSNSNSFKTNATMFGIGIGCFFKNQSQSYY